MMIVFPVLGAVFLTLFLQRRIHKANASSLICKGLTSICFVGLSFYGLFKAGANGANLGYPVFITVGLIFGLMGDLWLDLKYNCPEESDTYTFAGFWSFAVGHVFFLIALIRYMKTEEGLLQIILPIILAIVCGIAVGMGGKLLALDYGKFKSITMLYGALLVSSALVSGSLLIKAHLSSPVLILFFIGAVLFLVSDLILSGTYFGTGKNRPKDIISNHVFYYAGQFLIAASVVAFSGM